MSWWEKFYVTAVAFIESVKSLFGFFTSKIVLSWDLLIVAVISLLITYCIAQYVRWRLMPTRSYFSPHIEKKADFNSPRARRAEIISAVIFFPFAFNTVANMFGVNSEVYERSIVEKSLGDETNSSFNVVWGRTKEDILLYKSLRLSNVDNMSLQEIRKFTLDAKYVSTGLQEEINGKNLQISVLKDDMERIRIEHIEKEALLESVEKVIGQTKEIDQSTWDSFAKRFESDRRRSSWFFFFLGVLASNFLLLTKAIFHVLKRN